MRHVGSSRTRDWTGVPSVPGWIPNHCPKPSIFEFMTASEFFFFFACEFLSRVSGTSILAFKEAFCVLYLRVYCKVIDRDVGNFGCHQGRGSELTCLQRQIVMQMEEAGQVSYGVEWWGLWWTGTPTCHFTRCPLFTASQLLPCGVSLELPELPILQERLEIQCFTVTFPVAQLEWAELSSFSELTAPAMWETWVQSLGWEDPLKKRMAAHSSIPAWRIHFTFLISKITESGLWLLVLFSSGA